MKKKLLNLISKPVKIAEILVFLLIPLVYYFLIGGFKEKPTDTTDSKTYDPKSVIKRDFIEYILNGNLDSVIQSRHEYKPMEDTGRLYRIIKSQRVVITLPGGFEDGNEIYNFSDIKGYEETGDNGNKVLYLSSGNYIDNRQKLEKGYALQNISGKLPLKLLRDTIGSFELYFKPNLKIRRGDFSFVDTRPVAAVIIYDEKGKIADSIVIRVRNFSDMNGKYDGGYTDKYLTEVVTADNNFRIASDKLSGKNKYFGFQVSIYWFGEVDLWFEKLTVEDRIAKELFSGNYYYIIKEGYGIDEFYSAADLLRQNKIKTANYNSFNYVMNVLYDNVQNKTELP